MNRVFFGVKRAFQSTLRVTRRWMARIRMTPARFDMLKAISTRRDGLWQSDLRGLLGVTAQTISRMLRSLEELGMVRRQHDAVCDWKRLWVSLTKRGRKRLRRAEKVFIDSGALQLAVDCALLEPVRMADRAASHRATMDAESLFHRMRSAFHDRATLYDGTYPPY